MEHAQALFTANPAAAAFFHRPAGAAPFRNDPGVAVVEPIVMKSTLSPAGRRGIADLQIGGLAEDAAQGGERHLLLRSLPE